MFNYSYAVIVSKYVTDSARDFTPVKVIGLVNDITFSNNMVLVEDESGTRFKVFAFDLVDAFSFAEKVNKLQNDLSKAQLALSKIKKYHEVDIATVESAS